MPIIATHDLRRSDVPYGRFDWDTFSEFALTFDPFSEPAEEYEQVQASATPSDAWTATAIRYFLYCWQRIGNNQGQLTPEGIKLVLTACSVLRDKIPRDGCYLNAGSAPTPDPRHRGCDMQAATLLEFYIPVRRGMMNQMQAFYGDVLDFATDGSRFMVNNIVGVYGQLQYSTVNIDPGKNAIFKFHIPTDFPEYCVSLRDRGARFESILETPGGYAAKIFDPCGNSIWVWCDSFDSSTSVDLSTWEAYRRL
jgi:hypothetical protein